MVSYLLPPKEIRFEITYKCNLFCQHCYNNSGTQQSDELHTAEIFSVLTQAACLGVREIFFEGGEPLLREDIFDLLSFASGKFKVGLSTNGTILNDSFIELLKKTVDFVQVSVDAATPETYEIIRGNRSTFLQVIQNIKRLTKNNIPVVLTFVLMKLNVHEIAKFIKLSEELGADACYFGRLQLSGRAHNNKEILQLATQEYYQAQRLISRYKKTARRVKIITSFECFNFLFEPNLFCEPNTLPTVECGEGLAISPNGDVLPCVLLRNFKAGSVREEELKNIWLNSKVLNFFRTFSTIESCRECNYLPVCRCGCRGIAYLETGDVKSIDPLCPFLNKNEQKS